MVRWSNEFQGMKPSRSIRVFFDLTCIREKPLRTHLYHRPSNRSSGVACRWIDIISCHDWILF